MRISGFDEKKGRIEHLEIIKKVNEHSICKFEFLVLDNDFSNVENLPALGTKVVVQGDKYIFFKGQLHDIVFRKAYHETRLFVTSISYSYKSDIDHYQRIFQSTDKTYNKISKKLINDGMVISWEDKIGKKNIKNPIIEYNETEFSFLNRLARENGCFLFLDDTEDDKVKAHVGISFMGNSKGEDIKHEDIYQFAVNNTVNGIYCDVQLGRYCNLGYNYQIFGQIYCIHEVKILYNNDCTEYYYRCLKLGSMLPIKEKKYIVNFYPLGKAKVINSKDPKKLGRVQVEFIGIEDMITSDKRFYIQYLTPLTEKDGGVMWIPDKDEIVEVFCQNNQLVALGCNRQIKINNKYQNEEDRNILVREKKLTINKEKIELLAFEDKEKLIIKNNDIEIENEKFLIKLTDKEFRINEKSTKTTLLLDKEKIQILADKKIEEKAGKSAGIIEDSRVQFDSGSKVKISNDSVEVNTGSFEVK